MAAEQCLFSSSPMFVNLEASGHRDKGNYRRLLLGIIDIGFFWSSFLFATWIITLSPLPLLCTDYKYGIACCKHGSLTGSLHCGSPRQTSSCDTRDLLPALCVVHDYTRHHKLLTITDSSRLTESLQWKTADLTIRPIVSVFERTVLTDPDPR